MTDKVFGQTYADQYDLIYTEKDYEAECDLIEEVFRKYGDGEIKTILDLGCGTGNHAIPLYHWPVEVTKSLALTFQRICDHACSKKS